MAPETVPAYGPAGNGLIAYSKDGDIYVADPDGSSPRLLTGGPTWDEGPTFSRDGRRMAFARVESGVGQLMVANADGSDVTELIDNIEWIEWSPDSTELLVLHVNDVPILPSRRLLSIVDADSCCLRRSLDLGPLEPVDWANWRPIAGHEIYFKAIDPAAERIGIYSIRRDGTDLRRVLVSESDEFDRFFQAPNFSHDGSMIGYSTWGPNSAGEENLWGHVFNIETGEDRLDERFSWPAFSPDGKTLVGEGCGELLISNVDGSGEARQIGPPVECSSHWSNYEFSPDGTKLYWNVEDWGKTWIIDVASGDYKEIPAPMPPSWQRVAPGASVADQFVAPFEYVLPSTVGVTRKGRDAYRFHPAPSGSTAPYSSSAGVVVATLEGPATDGCPRRGFAGGIQLQEPPEQLIEDLGTKAGMTVEASPASLGGRDGFEIRVTVPPGCLDHLHTRSTGTADQFHLDLPSRIWLLDVGGVTVLVQVWAHGVDTFDTWLPTAMQLVESIRFL